jgi:hypothetical protein
MLSFLGHYSLAPVLAQVIDSLQGGMKAKLDAFYLHYCKDRQLATPLSSVLLFKVYFHTLSLEIHSSSLIWMVALTLGLIVVRPVWSSFGLFSVLLPSLIHQVHMASQSI